MGITVILVRHSKLAEPLGKSQFKGNLWTVKNVCLQLLITSLILQLYLNGHSAVFTVR